MAQSTARHESEPTTYPVPDPPLYYGWVDGRLAMRGERVDDRGDDGR